MAQAEYDVLPVFCSDFNAAQAPEFRAEPPAFLQHVTDPAVRQWALDVHALWNILYRVQSDSVGRHPERHSLLNLPHPAVCPGDRFRCAARAPWCGLLCDPCKCAVAWLCRHDRRRGSTDIAARTVFEGKACVSVISLTFACCVVLCREVYYW